MAVRILMPLNSLSCASLFLQMDKETKETLDEDGWLHTVSSADSRARGLRREANGNLSKEKGTK